MVLSVARSFGVDPNLIAAIGWHETHWNQLGAGRDGYTLGYGVPSSGERLTKYQGTENQVRGAAGKISRWQTFLGRALTIADMDAFAFGKRSNPSAPLGWQPDDPGAWARSVSRIWSGLSGNTAAEGVGPLADTASAEGTGPMLRVGLFLIAVLVLGFSLFAFSTGRQVVDAVSEELSE